MSIRFAREADIPGMLALLRQVGQVHHSLRPDLFREHCQKYDTAALRQLLRDDQRPILIAREADEVLGYCFCILRAYEKDSVMTDRRELYIDDLCVREDRRGQGIAGELYEAATALARERGCRYLTLNVWCGNEPAMRFYEKAGLTPRSITMEKTLC